SRAAGPPIATMSRAGWTASAAPTRIFFGRQPRSAHVPPNGRESTTATVQPASRQRDATAEVIPVPTTTRSKRRSMYRYLLWPIDSQCLHQQPYYPPRLVTMVWPLLLRRSMRKLEFQSILALIALVAGCAAPSARIGSAASGEDGSASPAARELNGTWRGNYWQLGMVLYDDDADCTLRISDGATFTAKCTRSSVGTNNLSKSSSWSVRAGR